MAQEIVPLFGGALANGRLGSGLARQTRREVEIISARAEIAQAADQSRALLTSSAMNNIGTLVSQAEQLMRIAPTAGPYFELLVNAYGVGAANSIARLQ